ncbi:alpha/beta hydrolase [Paenibacillus sp. P26]|nr:alpha/beta hydrolase [Paenibacillus sp. P26]
MFSLKWKAPLVVLLLLTGVISPAAAAKKEVPNRLFAGEEIPLWPGTAPGSGGLDLKQQVLERSTDPKVQDRAVTGITDPSIIPFFPPKGRANGAAVLIAPGGGYERVVIDKEGADIAEWLNSLGITAFVLKYRLPGEGHEVGYNVPLQDAQRAMRIIRQNADEWGSMRAKSA